MRLTGPANEAEVIVEGLHITALIDIEVQVSTISKGLCKHLGLRVKHVNKMLQLEGVGGFTYLIWVMWNLI